MRSITDDGECFGRGAGCGRIDHGGGGVKGAASDGPVSGGGGRVQAGELSVAQYQAGRAVTAQHQAEALGRSTAAEDFRGGTSDGEGFGSGARGGRVHHGGVGIEGATGDRPVTCGGRRVQAGELSTAQHQASRTVTPQHQAQTLGRSTAAEDFASITGDGERFGRGACGGSVHHGGVGIEGATGNRPVGGGGRGVQAGELATADHQAGGAVASQYQAQALGRSTAAEDFAGITSDSEGFGSGADGRRVSDGGSGVEGATGNRPVAGGGRGVQAGELTVAQHQAGRIVTPQHQTQAPGRRTSAEDLTGRTGDCESFRRGSGGRSVDHGGAGIEGAAGDRPVTGGSCRVQAVELSTA